MMNENLAPIKPNAGNEKNPKNFVGRKEISQCALEMLNNGQNILITDPRRMGKTFWMKAFAEEQKDKLRVVFIDYEPVKTADQFLHNTINELSKYKGIPERFIKAVKTFFEEVDPTLTFGPLSLKTSVRASGKTPIETMEILLDSLDKAIGDEEEGKPMVIAMDEVPDAIMNIIKSGSTEEANILMHSLRSLRGRCKNIHRIIAGSIGFHHVLKAANMTTKVLNDLNVLKFGPLEPSEAEELAQRLAKGIERKIDKSVIDEMVGETDGFPIIIQKLFDMMRPDGKESFKGSEITKEEYRKCLEKYFHSDDDSLGIKHYTERINIFYGNNISLAHTILRIMANADGALSRNELREKVKGMKKGGFDERVYLEVYDDLIGDHYLEERDKNGETVISWRYQVIKRIYKQSERL